jgi:hypothetical protein
MKVPRMQQRSLPPLARRVARRVRRLAARREHHAGRARRRVEDRARHAGSLGGGGGIVKGAGRAPPRAVALVVGRPRGHLPSPGEELLQPGGAPRDVVGPPHRGRVGAPGAASELTKKIETKKKIDTKKIETKKKSVRGSVEILRGPPTIRGVRGNSGGDHPDRGDHTDLIGGRCGLSGRCGRSQNFSNLA